MILAALLQHAGEFTLVKRQQSAAETLPRFGVYPPSCQRLKRASSSRLFLIEVFILSTSLCFQQLSKLFGILLGTNIPIKDFLGSVSQL